METLEEGIKDSVLPKNKFESQVESIQDVVIFYTVVYGTRLAAPPSGL